MELGELCSQLNILDWAIVYDGWLRNNVPKRLITFMWRHPGGKLVISVVQMFYDELIPISDLRSPTHSPDHSLLRSIALWET